MAHYDVRLEGGPADGDVGKCNILPYRIYATMCPRCDDWHWYPEPEEGAEVYRQQDVDRLSNRAKYVYTGLNIGNDLEVEVPEYEPITVNSSSAMQKRLWEAFRAVAGR